jgi:hypothetical protein
MNCSRRHIEKNVSDAVCLFVLFVTPSVSSGFCGFVFPTLMITYILDATYVQLFMSERITTVSYESCSSGVQLTMPVSERFQKALHAGGYVYVMAEWLSVHEWHAFSLYESPNDPSRRRIFLNKLGDWTANVHDKTADRNTSRPVWLSGPFPSPYNSAMEFDNIICVAAGTCHNEMDSAGTG